MGGKRKFAIFSIVFGCAVVLLALVGVMIYVFTLAPSTETRELPPDLREARIITGADFLTRSEFYQSGIGSSWRDLFDPGKLKSSLDSIEDVATGQLDGQPGLDVEIAGSTGTTLLDAQGKVKKHVDYQFETGSIELGPFQLERVRNSFYNIRIVDIEGDGVSEVLGYGGLDGAAIFNHQGHVLLSRGERVEGKPSIHEVTAGDVDGDGVLEFVASWGYKPWSGIELFGRNGDSRWRQKEEFKPKQCEIVDVDGDGAAEIVEEDGTQLKIRDAQGKVTGNVKMPVYLWHLSLCPRPDGHGPPQNLAVREGSLWLIDLDGKNFSKFDAPLSQIKLEKPRKVSMPGAGDLFTVDTEEVFRAKGVWVRLKKDQPKHLAVIANFAVLERSLFYVYDEQGRLAYHEILPEDCHAVAVLPSENEGGGEDILVAGETNVWRYAAR